MTLRLAAMGQEKYQGLAVRLPSGRAVFNGTIKLDEDALSKPFSWKKPTTVFVNSMSDLFHKDVPTWFIDKVWRVMASTPQHTYQVLTKRPDRMATYLSELWEGKVLPNVWCGTSVENEAVAHRVTFLRHTPAAIRFLSCEPLLGPLTLDLTDIHWVIAGAESGPGARLMCWDWARSLKDQCVAVGVPFFFKQNATAGGRKLPLPTLDGRQWTEMPEVPR
jgi:protein gp37